MASVREVGGWNMVILISWDMVVEDRGDGPDEMGITVAEVLYNVYDTLCISLERAERDFCRYIKPSHNFTVVVTHTTLESYGQP